MDFYVWSDEDVREMAALNGISLSEEQIEDICFELEDSLNNWDMLNEMISDEIFNKVKRYE